MPCQYRSKVWVNGWCDVAHRYCAATHESTCKYNKPTNADRIRAMSDEELALLLSEFCKGMEFCDYCVAKKDCPGESPVCWEKWLKQPAEVSE